MRRTFYGWENYCSPCNWELVRVRCPKAPDFGAPAPHSQPGSARPPTADRHPPAAARSPPAPQQPLVFHTVHRDVFHKPQATSFGGACRWTDGARRSEPHAAANARNPASAPLRVAPCSTLCGKMGGGLCGETCGMTCGTPTVRECAAR